MARHDELEYTEYKDVPYLTEDVIKHATMPFLKSYYRYRSNLMNSELETGDFAKAEFDLRTEAGIEIDGLLTYKERGGGGFLVSFEASSKASKEEVVYSVQKTLLRWDGFAIASVLATIILSSLYILKAIDIRYWGWGFMIFGLLMLIVVLALFYIALFSKVFQFVDRYHYIYAIEQFKKYHADEQWISVGVDIFEGPDDPYLEELKDQCITNGFGLIEIQENLKPLLLITPARQDVFKSNRKLVKFIPTKEFAQRFLDSRYAKALKRRFQKSRTRQLYLNMSRSRYERRYRSQVAVFFMCCLLSSALLWKELHEPDILEYDEADLAALNERSFDQYVRPESKPQDSIDRLNVQPFQEVTESYLDDNHDQPIFTLRDKEKPKNLVIADDDFVAVPILEELEEKKEGTPPEIGLYVFDRGEAIGEYPCERIAHENEVQYAVEESIHADKEVALRRIDTLARRQISTNILSLHCFDTKNDSFMVFFELLHDSLDVAETQRLLSEQKMKRILGIENPKLSIRRLERI